MTSHLASPVCWKWRGQAYLWNPPLRTHYQRPHLSTLASRQQTHLVQIHRSDFLATCLNTCCVSLVLWHAFSPKGHVLNFQPATCAFLPPHFSRQASFQLLASTSGMIFFHKKHLHLSLVVFRKRLKTSFPPLLSLTDLGLLIYICYHPWTSQ